MSRKSSSGNMSHVHPYIAGIPEQDLIRCKIIREHPSKPDSHVRIIQNGIETYNSRKR